MSDDRGRARDGREGGAATLAEVAREAGVSPATVSRFMRGLPVRREARIADAVERLRYRPNAAARGLRMRSTEAIGVVVYDITNPYAAALVRGVQSAADGRWVSLFQASGAADPFGAIADLGGRVDGIVCAAATEGSPLIDALDATRKPAVVVEFEPSDHPHGLDVVVLDNTGGARAAIRHLLELGHERIGIVAGSDTISVGRERLLGAEQAAADWEGPVELVVERTSFDEEGGYQAAARLLGRAAAPTAIFAPNNLTSLGALRLLRDLGMRVPADVSFVGFDPIAASELFSAPPTFVDRPESEQGALAMRMLESRLAGRGRAEPRRVVLETTLVPRASTAPPPRPRRRRSGPLSP